MDGHVVCLTFNASRDGSCPVTALKLIFILFCIMQTFPECARGLNSIYLNNSCLTWGLKKNKWVFPRFLQNCRILTFYEINWQVDYAAGENLKELVL